MSSESPSITHESLWQSAFDEVWNKIAPFVAGPDNRGKIPPCKYDEVFLKGGRGSGKSYVVSLWLVMSLTNDHRKNAVVIRKTASSIRKSCFKQVVKAIRKLHMDSYWDVNKTDMTITHKITKQQIVFCGLDDEEKVRSLTTTVGYFSIVWFEEAKQFSSMEEIRQTQNSVLRGGGDDLDDSDSDEEAEGEFMTFLTYNPPKSAMDWINKEALKTTIENRLTHKSTYLTMPVRWLGKAFIRRAENLKNTDERRYRHEYLGEVTGTGGQYFHNLEIRPITDEEIASFDWFEPGIDWGMTDPNVFVKTYEDDGILYIFDEIYQEGAYDGKYHEFGEEVKEHMAGFEDDEIFSDAQGKAEAEMFQKEFDLNVQFAPKGPKSRDMGYDYLRTRRRIVIDPVRCPHCAEEFQIFECKPRPNGGGWTDSPGIVGDHCPDAVRYARWRSIMGGGIGY